MSKEENRVLTPALSSNQIGIYSDASVLKPNALSSQMECVITLTGNLPFPDTIFGASNKNRSVIRSMMPVEAPAQAPSLVHKAANQSKQ